MGKPDAVIYVAAMASLGGLRPQEVLAVGDSLEHDIAGAAAAGVDSLFVGGGIHARELGMGLIEGAGEGGGLLPDVGALERLCGEFKIRPTYAMAFLRW